MENNQLEAGDCLKTLNLNAATDNKVGLKSTIKTDAPTHQAFTSHSAMLDAGPSQFSLRALKMNGCTMLYLGGKDVEAFDELAVAMPARAPSKDIVSSTIMGGYGQTESVLLATKLSKRFDGRQFYVSMNVKPDRIDKPLFEKALMNYMRDHLEQFV